MSKPSLEELKQDMEQKRKTAYAYAYVVYDDAVAPYADGVAAADAYAAAKKKYEKALEQAPATSSDEVQKQRDSLFRMMEKAMEHINDTELLVSWDKWKKAALEKNDEEA